MSLIIEQRFPLGRFHATRWKQNPFEDRYGEWPPSPWRLLRALTARWFQYDRELDNANEPVRDELLRKLASELPVFALPTQTWRGPAIKQYQPTSIEWTDKSKKAAAVKLPQRTLVEDRFRAVPSTALFWLWEGIVLSDSEAQLLDQLTDRILYFGRAESFSRLRRVEDLPDGVTPNCFLKPEGTEETAPVLAQIPDQPLNIEALLAITDDKQHLRRRPVPPGTKWFYAEIPRLPHRSPAIIHRSPYPDGLNSIQFAVGGSVYPPVRQWVKITSRFRGRALRELAKKIAPHSQGKYALLTADEREKIALMAGKDRNGRPLRGHRHTFFLLWPDAEGRPTRFIAWRSSPFTSEEIESLLRASEWPIAWDNRTPDWKLRIVPLPFSTAAPKGLFEQSRIWTSLTPFVLPAERRRFRKNGRARAGESLKRILSKLLQKVGKPAPATVTLIHATQSWMHLHETRERRLARRKTRTPWARPGFLLKVEFDNPVTGPLILGDSCHFGLGFFAAQPSDTGD